MWRVPIDSIDSIRGIKSAGVNVVAYIPPRIQIQDVNFLKKYTDVSKISVVPSRTYIQKFFLSRSFKEYSHVFYASNKLVVGFSQN